MFETRIKALRVSLGLNQVEFAGQLSATKQSVSNWENGNILPSIDMLIKICNTFSVSANYLLGLDDKRTLDVSNLNDKQITYIQQIINDLRK